MIGKLFAAAIIFFAVATNYLLFRLLLDAITYLELMIQVHGK